MGGSTAIPAIDRQAAGMASASALVLKIQAALLSQSGLPDGATALANELARGLGCERVTVGWLEHGAVRVIGCSYVSDLDARRALFERIAAAMDEAIEQGTAILLSAGETTSNVVTLAHREALALGSGSLCTVRLMDRGRAVGAITLERNTPPLGPAECAFCQDLACLLGPLLELQRRSARSAARVALEACRELLAGPAALHLRARRWTLAVLAAAAGAMLVPIPYHVGAPARLEGSLQRVVAAPIDGFLEQVGARPGDRVRANQVLAELSRRDLNTERSKRQSELAQHENLYGAALARADRTQLVIHHAKAAEVSAQLALIEHQLERAHIRAPFDGVVLKGDLTQSVGAPVQRGEVLMTLAPDETFRLIVEVDERDIAHLQPGQPGRLALAATPGETLAFRVHRILPVAAAADGRTFFEVEAAFERASATLRPGLRGVAKISVGERSAVWIATHRAFDWLRLQLWSLGA